MEVEQEPMPPKMRRFMAKYARRNTDGKIARRKAKSLRASISRKKTIKIAEAQNWDCFYCGRKMIKKSKNHNNPDLVTIDHDIPISRGGDNTRANLVASHAKCNHEKSDLTGAEYLEAK